MKTPLTAKLKLQTTPEQFASLRSLQLAYRDALNYASRYAFAHGKLSNKAAIQNGTYLDLRAKFGLGAQMACSVPRQVGATYKGLWKKVKQNATARKAGHTRKRYKGLDKPPKYLSPTVTYQQGRDYTFKSEQRVSVLTLSGRILLPYSGYTQHIAWIEQGAELGTALLYYDKPKKQFYLLVALQVETPDPTPDAYSEVVGVDVGQRYLATTTTLTNHTTFVSGKHIRHQANHYHRSQKRLQRKGTRSATRRKITRSGRERRFRAAVNHTVAKHLIKQHPHAFFGLEDLTHIRERTGKWKHGKKASKKQRRANRDQASWSFAELHSMISYKAGLSSSLAVKVDADYTSQMCVRCGHTARENRPKKGLLFVCQVCNYRLHADLLGARNIALRTLLVLQDWASTGELSSRPDVSSEEIKGERLLRSSHLRWSSDTSSRL